VFGSPDRIPDNVPCARGESRDGKRNPVSVVGDGGKTPSIGSPSFEKKAFVRRSFCPADPVSRIPGPSLWAMVFPRNPSPPI